MSLGIIASIVLSLIVVYFVLMPLFEPALDVGVGLRNEGGAISPLLDAKERALRALKDLDLDFSMGKVSQEDFEASKKALSLEVANILNEIGRRSGEKA